MVCAICFRVLSSGYVPCSSPRRRPRTATLRNVILAGRLHREARYLFAMRVPANRLAGVALAAALLPRGARADSEPPEETRTVVATAAPPPTSADYIQYGVTFTGEFVADAGPMC